MSVDLTVQTPRMVMWIVVEEMSVDLTVQTPRMVMWIVSLVCLPSFSLFSAFCLLFFVAILGAVSRYQWHSIFFLSLVFHEAAHIRSR